MSDAKVGPVPEAGKSAQAGRKLPPPEMVFADTSYGTAYAWKCEGHGIVSLGNTRLDAQVQFQKDFEAEYGETF